MKIQCPDCGTSYDIKASVLGAEGRSVKCTRCASKWFVEPPADEDEDLVSFTEDEQPTEVPDPPEADSSKDEESWAEDEVEETGGAAEKAPDPVKKKPDEKAQKEEVDPPNPADIETLAKRPKISVNPNKFKRSKIAPIFNWLMRQNYRRVAGVIIFGVAVWTCFLFFVLRDNIVKQVPDLASLYEMIGMDVNLRGLEFRDLRIFSELQEGKQVLVVEGSIHNIHDDSTPVPAIRLSIRDNSTQEIYSWTVDPKTRLLQPLDETRFRTMLEDPPSEASTIQVWFVERGAKEIILE
ncbi:MAG: zinc-ribbon domain-containing protein [Rhodobacteraceae bacterium]|nr:zinc-ribbon domain-containing protein [Paracoccaceae bacterium]